MISVTKKFTFDMAHRLEGHKGLCKNVHGHGWVLLVSFTGKTKEGMVMDFKQMKTIVNSLIVWDMDHAYCYNKNDIHSKKIANFLKKEIDQKLKVVNFRVTSENLAKYILSEINIYLSINKLGVICNSVKLYEGEGSYAEAEVVLDVE